MAELTKRWSAIDTLISPGTNGEAAQADLVVLATPWEGAVTTVKELAPELSGKIVVSMVNAMTRWGDRFVPVAAADRFGGGRRGQSAPREPGGRGLPPHSRRAPWGPAHQMWADVMVFSD